LKVIQSHIDSYYKQGISALT